MFQQPVLSLDDAKRVAAAARAEAQSNGWAVVIAVVDDGGHLMYLERMDGCQKASSRIAEDEGQNRHPVQAADQSDRGRGPRRAHRDDGAARRRSAGRRGAAGQGRSLCRSDRRVRRAILPGRSDRPRGRCCSCDSAYEMKAGSRQAAPRGTALLVEADAVVQRIAPDRLEGAVVRRRRPTTGSSEPGGSRRSSAAPAAGSGWRRRSPRTARSGIRPGVHWPGARYRARPAAARRWRRRHNAARARGCRAAGPTEAEGLLDFDRQANWRLCGS